ncbi:hypothetical protein BH10PAT1_BH10PAT1_4150 [soil metagenome]
MSNNTSSSTNSMLRAIINGQSAMKGELLGEIKKLDTKIDNLDKKIDDLYNKLHKRVTKIEKKLQLA